MPAELCKPSDVTQKINCHPTETIKVKYWIKSYPDSNQAKHEGCEVGRTHFCSFSISHKPTQLFQDIRCLEPCLHFSFNTTIQPTLPANKQTGSDAADIGQLVSYPGILLLPFSQHRCSCSREFGEFAPLAASWVISLSSCMNTHAYSGGRSSMAVRKGSCG